MGTAMGDKCEICSREAPSVNSKLWVGEYYRKYKMCVNCLITIKDFTKFGINCRIEPYTEGEPETNYKIVELYGKKYLHQSKKEEIKDA